MIRSREIESVATAILICAVSGLLLPTALFVSLNRATLLWLLSSVAAGLALSSPIESTLRFSIKGSAIAAGANSLSFVGYWIVRWLLTKLQNPNETVVYIPLGSGAIFNPLDSKALAFTAALLFVCFLASWILVFTSALASRSIVAGYNTFI